MISKIVDCLIVVQDAILDEVSRSAHLNLGYNEDHSNADKKKEEKEEENEGGRKGERIIFTTN